MGIIKIKEVSKSFRDKSQEILDRKNDKAKFKFLKYITYRKLVKALNCVTFSVNKGEIFGLLGPNGAGKTTLSKMIVGLLKPDKGRVLVFDKQGDDINKESRRFNVVFARANLFYELSGRENLEFFFHITNAHEFLNLDLSKSTHGEAEIEDIKFVDPAKFPIVPKFLMSESFTNIANQPTKIFNYL